MKCPKCHYLGMDTGPRCRHCGYEFSLSDFTGDADAGASSEPRLRRGTASRHTPASPRERHERPVPTPGLALERPLSRVPDSGPLDLPLFPEDESGVPLVPVPRAPLGVRRSTATPARHRPRVSHGDVGAYDLGLESPEAAPPPESPEPVVDDHRATAPDVAPDGQATTRALPLRRLAAAGTDLALIAAIDVTVLYFTLRVSELSVSQLWALPPIPMAAFFAILNGGYFVVFTGVFGQTLGKMLAGIEVVAQDLTSLDFGRALYRGIVSLLSFLTAGLGFVPALVGEGRSLHDRIAGTRVVLARSGRYRT